MVAGVRGSGSGEWQWRQRGARCPIRHPTRPAQDGTLMSHGGDPRTVRTAWWPPLLPGAVHKKAGVPLRQSQRREAIVKEAWVGGCMERTCRDQVWAGGTVSGSGRREVASVGSRAPGHLG